MDYYLLVDGETRGPYTRSQLARMWDAGVLTARTQYAVDGSSAWKPLRELLEDAVTSEASRTVADAGNSRRQPRARSRGWIPKIIFAGSLLGMAATVVLVVQFVRWEQGNSTPNWITSLFEVTVPNTFPAEKYRDLMVQYQGLFNAQKQSVLNYFYPTGRATGIKIQAIELNWKPDAPRRRDSDLSDYRVHATLYWQDTLVSDGYSEVEFQFSGSGEHCHGARVKNSNAIASATFQDLGDAARAGFEEFVRTGIRHVAERAVDSLAPRRDSSPQ